MSIFMVKDKTMVAVFIDGGSFIFVCNAFVFQNNKKNQTKVVLQFLYKELSSISSTFLDKQF